MNNIFVITLVVASMVFIFYWFAMYRLIRSLFPPTQMNLGMRITVDPLPVRKVSLQCPTHNLVEPCKWCKLDRWDEMVANKFKSKSDPLCPACSNGASCCICEPAAQASYSEKSVEPDKLNITPAAQAPSDTLTKAPVFDTSPGHIKDASSAEVPEIKRKHCNETLKAEPAWKWQISAEPAPQTTRGEYKPTFTGLDPGSAREWRVTRPSPNPEHLHWQAGEFVERSVLTALQTKLDEAIYAGTQIHQLAMSSVRERDEARAEVEHWRKKYGYYVDKWCDTNVECDRYRQALERIAKLDGPFLQAHNIARKALENK